VVRGAAKCSPPVPPLNGGDGSDHENIQGIIILNIYFAYLFIWIYLLGATSQLAPHPLPQVPAHYGMFHSNTQLNHEHFIPARDVQSYLATVDMQIDFHNRMRMFFR